MSTHQYLADSCHMTGIRNSLKIQHLLDRSSGKILKSKCIYCFDTKRINRFCPDVFIRWTCIFSFLIFSYTSFSLWNNVVLPLPWLPSVFWRVDIWAVGLCVWNYPFSLLESAGTVRTLSVFFFLNPTPCCFCLIFICPYTMKRLTVHTSKNMWRKVQEPKYT